MDRSQGPKKAVPLLLIRRRSHETGRYRKQDAEPLECQQSQHDRKECDEPALPEGKGDDDDKTDQARAGPEIYEDLSKAHGRFDDKDRSQKDQNAAQGRDDGQHQKDHQDGLSKLVVGKDRLEGRRQHYPERCSVRPCDEQADAAGYPDDARLPVAGRDVGMNLAPGTSRHAFFVSSKHIINPFMTHN